MDNLKEIIFSYYAFFIEEREAGVLPFYVSFYLYVKRVLESEHGLIVPFQILSPMVEEVEYFVLREKIRSQWMADYEELLAGVI